MAAMQNYEEEAGNNSSDSDSDADADVDTDTDAIVNQNGCS